VTTHNINEPNLARCIFSRDLPLGHGDACGHNGQGEGHSMTLRSGVPDSSL